MKTKIIYISGGEVFAPNDIRNALDELRKTMELSADTVLFGVPVDSDDAGLSVNDAAYDQDAATIKISTEKPKKSKKVEAAKDPLESSAPILSVLGAVAESNSEPKVEPDTTVKLSVVSESIEIELNSEPQPEKIQTIEDILAELAPLREEKPIDLSDYDADEDIKPVQDQNSAINAEFESDATLSKMAEEFISKDDAPDAKPVKSGRIGKLKNILPFKKQKKEESSMLGDLFGWAGIAANDDDEKFSMPDFFRANN